MKKAYEKPLSEWYNLQTKESLLVNSAERMNTVTGSWDEVDPLAS